MTSKPSRGLATAVGAACALAGGAYALTAQGATAQAVGSTGLPADLTASQQYEQQLVDAISQTQANIDRALRQRSAAVLAYANAAGKATLQVRKAATAATAAPTAHAKTGASGGGANNETEFEGD